MTDNSQRPIAVGDLVQIIAWPCCGWKLGIVRTVKEFEASNTARCGKCFRSGPSTMYARFSPDGDAPVAWLKRIPPLDELESNDLCHPMKEPA